LIAVANATLNAARAALRGAEASAGARIGVLEEIEDIRRAAELWSEVWLRAGEPPVSGDLLRAMAHAGNYVSGAFDGERMVGALFGFYGGEDRPDHVHSHILGVDHAARAHGVGFALKVHQRLWALEHGIGLITWTADPLVRANAYFNLSKLAATGVEYYVNFYGEMPDAINGGDQSDRVLLRWDLESAEVERALGPGAAIGTPVAAYPAGAEVALEVGAGGAPVSQQTQGELLLCQVPEDIVAVRRADPALAMAWRQELRAVLSDALGRGLAVTAMDRAGWYLVSRPG
jgi:predicted GNAT superfamily acetyltransferase